MSDIRQQYHRLDEWMRNLSRIQYAVLIGLASALSVLAIGTLMSDSVTFEAVVIGLSMTVVYYAWNPNQRD
jgi:uncharacterized membrane protein